MSSLHVQLEYFHAMEMRTGCRFFLRPAYDRGAPWLPLGGYHTIALLMHSPRRPEALFVVSEERIAEYEDSIDTVVLSDLLDMIESFLLDRDDLLPLDAPMRNDSIFQLPQPLPPTSEGTPQTTP